MSRRRSVEKVENYDWIHITDDFFKSLPDLEIGEVLRDDLFGLFEAMSAMEMMEPKMDSGLTSNRKKQESLTWEEAVETKVISLESIPNSIIVGVIDNVLMGLMSWLEGDMLLQTVFINLYLHKPHLIQHKVMRPLCLGVYKIIDVIKEIIYKSRVFEDEDFQSFQNGYRLNPDVEQTKMLDMLLKTEMILDKKIKNQRHDKNKDLFYLHKRFQFIKSLHVCLVSFFQYTNNGEVLMIIDLKNVISFGIHLLKSIIESVNYDNDDPKWKLSLGIQPMINQRYLPATFPKYTKNKTIRNTYEYFIKLYEDLNIICDIIHHNHFHKVLNFIYNFNIKNPCLLSRSIIQLIYLNYEDFVFVTIPFTQVLQQSILSFNSTRNTSVFTSNNLTVSITIDDFIKISSKYFKYFIRIFGYNRSRQREKIENLLQEIKLLQEQSQQVDISLKTQLFTPWVHYYTLKLINYYLLSGFELELYSYFEYPYIYWYLQNLYSHLTNLLHDIPDDPRSNHEFSSEKTYYKSLHHLAIGYFNAISGFIVNQKIKNPKSEYDQEELRFFNRFKFLKNLIYPRNVHYGEYKKVYNELHRFDAVTYFQESYKCFKEARVLMDTLPKDYNVGTLNNVAKTNLVVVKLLASDYKKDSCPEFVFNIDKYFPIIKLN